jgi:hypothetical protein
MQDMARAPAETYASINAPAIWRSARTKIEALSNTGMDEIDIPAFLRRRGSDGDDHDEALKPMRFGVDRQAQAREPIATEAFPIGRHAAVQIVRIFNAAVRPGLSFRQALRSVTESTPDPRILRAVEAVSSLVGTRIKAWSCFLIWAHRLNIPGSALSDAALALVTAQLHGVDVQPQESARALFEEVTA